MNKNLIKHTLENNVVTQRAVDGYINATALCKASGKLIGHYFENFATKEFLKELESAIGIPIDELVSKRMTGLNEQRGTWVHPYVAINLGQWLSAKFAVQVSQWVFDWMNEGYGFDLEYQKFLDEKAEVKKNGSESGRYMANLRWHIYPALDKKEKAFEGKRQLSLFTNKMIH